MRIELTGTKRVLTVEYGAKKVARGLSSGGGSVEGTPRLNYPDQIDLY
ncbi:hypothetical protein [Haloferax sp. Q22]|nr:hypothetical protein [Haloferax sp. Q22]